MAVEWMMWSRVRGTETLAEKTWAQLVYTVSLSPEVYTHAPLSLFQQQLFQSASFSQQTHSTKHLVYFLKNYRYIIFKGYTPFTVLQNAGYIPHAVQYILEALCLSFSR